MTSSHASPRVAIACQGGGSHTAFTAGVLKHLLKEDRPFDVVGLSGTSGGAICAALAWQGLLLGGGTAALERFWSRNLADSLQEVWLNNVVIHAVRAGERGGLPSLNPNDSPVDWAHRKLKREVRALFEPERIAQVFSETSPHLYVSAVNVLSGEFKVFKNLEVSAQALLASAAIPSLFQAVEIEGDYYWDGIFSQNPPLLSLLDARPDELWVVQINPKTRAEPPRSFAEITDRHNELIGNLSLERDLQFIERMNDLIAKGDLTGDGYRTVKIRRITMNRDLDYASKLDRRPGFIRNLMDYGEEEAAMFLTYNLNS